MKYLYSTLLLILYTSGFSQVSTSAEDILQSLKVQNELIENSIVKNLEFKNIGPSVMSGRVTDLEVNPNNPSEFYVAYASGGLWHTVNNGNTFSPIMDNSDTQNIGDFDIDWNTRLIIVGTGENNSSRSSYAGIGILKSNDNGKTWTNIGLNDSHHIGKIVINPNNPNEIVVAVLGHLYSKNKERGIFKTIDGGVTWENTLYIDESTGIIDLDISPNNFKIQFASSWQKSRKAWDFKGNGEKSGIYKSVDSGNTWNLISTQKSGFPTGNGVGRIGLAVFDSKTLYAVVDNQFRRPKSKASTEKTDLSKNYFESISKEIFLKIDDLKLDKFLATNSFPKKYNSTKIKELVKNDLIKPSDLKLYLEDANTVMFETPIIGAQVYRSDDGGLNWTLKNSYYLDRLYNTYGYYFGKIHVSPVNKDDIYIYGVPFIKSNDGGVTYKSIDYPNVHVDHHDLWINPKNPKHLINGNDGGVNMSYDDGENWLKLNQPSVGQFYTINVDNEIPYNVYGGLQDNGVWMASSASKESLRWHQTGQNNWKSIMGGDGMQVQIDNRDSNIIYTGSQFGVYYRINKSKRTYIKPKHELGESPLRFNWQTPILLSPHNQDILYLGSNKLHTSFNKGDKWSFKSKDLTNGIKKGNVPFGTLSSIDESIFKFGKLVTGSDDGLIQLSFDGGNHWKIISNDLPENLWVSRVVFSKHKENRIYVTLNGYRFDDFKPYVFVTEDNGENWKSLNSNLPISSLNVIKEDPYYEDLLYLGTDNGVYMSFDKGLSWNSFNQGLQKVATHDLVIQKRAKDLLIGTHGRSIYKMDLSIIYSFLEKRNLKQNHYIILNDINFSSRWGSRTYNWSEFNLPIYFFNLYSIKDQQLTMKLLDSDKNLIYKMKLILEEGFQKVDLPIVYPNKNMAKKNKIEKSAYGEFYLKKGQYEIVIGDVSEKFDIK
ncbi:glycosyl hydrolase [Flavobacteriaceae bacterium]|nr:glycosyl hydrolase [Flavobacteriaceae bacterium]MDB4006992.1 glycosyl hydrolase [Flavobacteriaceae bacterium]MDB4024464.1 glycosyl hydrolase [Flavobacteriaceae bacterium]MDC1335856.1 glycosyl hydrolase [Flavobacteriaceae bacterium]